MKVEEIFVPLPIFPDYSVSNYGRIIHNEEEGELYPWANRRTSGRLKVRVRSHGAYMDFWLDELVAEAFFVDYHEGIDIYYKNGNKYDCTVLNLTFIRPEIANGETKEG